MAFHIVHGAVEAALEPVPEPGLVLRQRHAGDADPRKAQLPGPSLDIAGQTPVVDPGPPPIHLI